MSRSNLKTLRRLTLNAQADHLLNIAKATDPQELRRALAAAKRANKRLRSFLSRNSGR